MNIDKVVLDNVYNNIVKYNLFSYSDLPIVGYSGGKDSIFLLYVLRELGYNYKAVTVDLNFENNWGEKVKSIANQHGFTIDIIDTIDKDLVTSFSPERSFEFEKRLLYLKELSNFNTNNTIPCTQCFNLKILLLEALANKLQSNKILLGHHKTDAIVTYLKSFFYYIDRWIDENRVFEYDRFLRLIDQYRKYFLINTISFSLSEIYQSIYKYSKSGYLSADESPVHTIYGSKLNVKVVRPLYFVDEVVISYFINKHNLIIDLDSCFYNEAKRNLTPRELIHNKIISSSIIYKTYNDISNTLFPLILDNISSNGENIINTRNCRAAILGKEYRSNMDSIKL